MRERGFDVAVMTSPGEILDRFVADEQVLAERIPMERRITPLKDLVALISMIRAFRRLRPTIVHASTPKGGLLGTIAGRICGAPVVVYHVRGLVFTGSAGLQRLLLRTTEMIACALAHRVLCVSNSVRNELIAEGLCSRDKAVVLLSGSSNGVDSARFSPASQGSRDAVRGRYGIPQNAVVAGFVGRLVRDKGIVELADAWGEVSRAMPNAWLLMVGPWEPRDPVPDTTREKLEGSDRVVIAGAQPDMAALYPAMDVVVLPTYREGFPNVPLEAAAMELPTIVSDATGCVDAVIDGVTGTVVPVRNSDVLSRAMKGYLSDETLRRKHGQAGRQRVLADFRPSQIWEAVRAEYENLLRAKGIETSASAGP